MTGPLPYIDTHTVTVALGPDQVWTLVRQYAEQVGLGERSVLARILGTTPTRGFEIVEEVAGERLTLSGRHRFAVYRLTFAVEPRTSQRTTLLHATSHAAFPGFHGRVYRALVIGTGLHVVATKGMLRSIVRRGVSDGD